MRKGKDNLMKKSGLKKIGISSLLILMGLLSSCSGFTVGGVVPNDAPVTAPFPAKPASEYGKFVVYYVGDGKIKSLPDASRGASLIQYRVSDIFYHPAQTTKNNDQQIYNIQHPCGDGYDNQIPPVRDKEQTIFYKDFPYNNNDPYACTGFFPGQYRIIRSASDQPEAIEINDWLYFYYTNPPFLVQDDTGWEAFACECLNSAVCVKIDGTWLDFSDTPNDANQDFSTLGKLNCYFRDVIEQRFPAFDEDWIKIPISQLGYTNILPLRIKLVGDQINMKGARILQLLLYETPANGVPVPGVDKPVASSRFGIDFSRMQDPFIGYMARPNRDYWLLIKDWTAEKGINRGENYSFLVFVEATPVEPVKHIYDHTSPAPVIEPTAYIYRAGLQRARSKNPDLDNGPSFEPDDPRTKIEDIYPDCDGVPGTGDEGDWGIYEICPAESGDISDPNKLGIRDGNTQYWEVDNKYTIDDGEYFKGVKTNLTSLGDESPSVIQVDDQLWMFVSTGSGIFQLTSMDGLKGLQWNLNNIYQNKPSIVPRQYDPNVPGDPEAPVVSSGRYGICDTKAQGDDVQAIPVGKGYPDAICITYGEDQYLDSSALVDEKSVSKGTPIINSGPDGLINTIIFPSCVSYREPVFSGYFQVKTEAPGNPDLFCGDSVTGASDETAYLLGDDQWATNAIGLNPAEYWRNQNCNPFRMNEEFNRCALGSRSNAVAIKPGGDGQLQTASAFLKGDDRFCHQGDLVGICPGKDNKFNNDSTQKLINKLKDVLVDVDSDGIKDDEFCVINPAGGLEYIRFKYSNPVQLKHNRIVPGSEVVVSWTLTFYKYSSGFYGWPALGASEILTPGIDYSIDYTTGEITMLNNNWLAPIASLGFDPGFFGDANNRLKDVLLVYYRYQGSQIGICPGANGTIDTPRYFYASWIVGDHILGGPVLELSPSFGAALGVNRIDLPGLGDTYVDNITWDSTQMLFVCAGTDCPISPGSDETMDTAWAVDGSPGWWFSRPVGWNAYSWPPSSPNNLRPYIAANRFDLYGQADDWLCLIDNQWALCPGENGYFQIYQLWEKVEVHRYEGMDDLLFNYKKYNDPCYILETITEQDEFYSSEETIYVQNAYRGVMGDDRIVWNPQTKEYEISTGMNGVNQSCVAPSDSQLIPRYQGQPYQRIINPGANGKLDTEPLKDELFFEEIENEKPIPKIKAGPDGICNSYRIGDDRAEIFLGTGLPDYACVLAGPNGIANTTASGNDTQLYLPGEKTGFDAFQVDTPEIVKEEDKLYLYYAGLGWLKTPKTVPPDRGALGSLGECKRPGLDNRWGNTSYNWSSNPMDIQPGRSLLTRDGNPHMSFINALDDNQGVLLAPRIGVAISTVQRIRNNPSDWDRVLKPAVDVGNICQARIAGNLMSIVGGLTGGAFGGDVSSPPAFNYYGSFSPEVIVKHNEADDQPIFLMFLNGLWLGRTIPGLGAEPTSYNAGLFWPDIQIGLARSVDGIHFDMANDINPLIVSGDLLEGINWALGGILGGETRPSFLHPTIFKADNDSYGMIYKVFYGIGISDSGETDANLIYKSYKEWLGFAVRTGAVYGGGLAGLISCKINPKQLQSSQNWFRLSASAVVLLPILGLIIFRIWSRKSRKYI